MKQLSLPAVLMLLLTGCDGGIVGGWHQDTVIDFAQVPTAVATQFRVDHPNAAVDEVELCKFGQETASITTLNFILSVAM